MWELCSNFEISYASLHPRNTNSDHYSAGAWSDSSTGLSPKMLLSFLGNCRVLWKEFDHYPGQDGF